MLYTGNYLDGTLRGKQQALYGKHAGVCLETAHLPDSVNRPEFPSIILRPGQTYRQTCIYRFVVSPSEGSGGYDCNGPESRGTTCFTVGTENTIAVTPKGGKRNHWNAGDAFKITNGYPTMDQIGRGRDAGPDTVQPQSFRARF